MQLSPFLTLHKQITLPNVVYLYKICYHTWFQDRRLSGAGGVPTSQVLAQAVLVITERSQLENTTLAELLMASAVTNSLKSLR
jgi:hypothetical protein